ncbi:hypothetical protein TYRP_017584 [Tyrophagus putrescentiae]|nr:hypothetical protein TYRP_017584 [Tyrophagus putrescentiae]
MEVRDDGNDSGGGGDTSAQADTLSITLQLELIKVIGSCGGSSGGGSPQSEKEKRCQLVNQ